MSQMPEGKEEISKKEDWETDKNLEKHCLSLPVGREGQGHRGTSGDKSREVVDCHRGEAAS
jgi:hypothetical protein